MNLRSARAGAHGMILVALLSLGCAIPTRVASVSADIPRELTPIAIDSGLAAMDDPVTKQRIARMMKSREAKELERELVAGVLDGSLAALGEKERAERLGALSSRYLGGLLHGLLNDGAPRGGAGRAGASKGASGVGDVRHLVGSLAEAGVQPIVRSISEADVSSAVARAITEQLGPAIEKVLTDNLAPGLAAALASPQVQDGLGETARVLGREIVLGANEGIAKIQEGKPPREGTVLERVGELASKGATVATTLTWFLVAAVLVLVAWIVKLLVGARRYRAESERRAATTRLLAGALKASDGKPWADELLAAMEEQSSEDEDLLVRVRAARRARRRALNGHAGPTRSQH